MTTESRELPELLSALREIVSRYDIRTVGHHAGRFLRRRGPALIAAVEAALAHSRAQDSGGEATVPAGWCTLGVGDGSGGLFVYGPYEAIKACQRLILAAEQPAKGEFAGMNCRQVPPGNGYCDHCAAGNPQLCRYVTSQPSDPADAEKWGQQYRCGCFLGFPTKRAIPASCPQHMRDKQGGALPLDATPPTALRQAPSVDAAAVLRAYMIRLTGCVDFTPNTEAIEAMTYALSAHGAGAAVEAVATLPIDVHGRWYEVPIPVHVHVVSLREQLERGDATSTAFRDIRDAIEHCVAAADEGVDYAVSRPMLDALTTLGLIEKCGRGKWRPTDAGKHLAQTAQPRLDSALSTQPLLSYQPAGVRVDHAVQGIKRT